MSAGNAVFAALAGVSVFAAARGLAEAMRAGALAEWVAGTSHQPLRLLGAKGVAGMGLRLLTVIGRMQEDFPRIKAFSRWMHASPEAWLGESDPGSPAWLAGKQFLAVAVGLLFGWLSGDRLIGAVAGAGAFFFPDLFARSAWESRQARLRRELPDTLDLMILSLEAGLSLDSSFAQVSGKMRGGILPQAFTRMMGEVRFGMKRYQAWREMARRLGNPELTEAVETLIQADSMGTGLAGALRGIAGQVRVRSRQRAEESAHKASVKILFPLAFFIFPSIFIVLLGPVFLQLLGVIE